MSISLNNHESRIVALEKYKNFQIQEVKSGVNGYIKFVNGVLIQWVRFDRNSFDGNNNWAVAKWPTSFSEKPWNISVTLVANNASEGAYDQNVSINYGQTSATQLVYHQNLTAYPRYSTMILAIGLKIYYIFRYNIYKILKLISPILKF